MRDFLDIFETRDTKCKAAHKQFQTITNDTLWANRCSSGKENNSNVFHPYNNRSSSIQQTSLSHINSKCVCPPKLTDDERDIISRFSGCFKCRKIFVPNNHTASTCPDGFPSPDNYKPLTLDFANKMKLQHAGKQSKSSSTMKAVAAIGNALPSASILEVNSLSNLDFVASIFGPLAGSSVISDASFSYGDVSVSPPFKSKHFVWKCTIDGPSVEFPLKQLSLIDNGSHLVLIQPESVCHLGLPMFPLPEPELVDVVISSSASKKLSLTHYVKIKLTSLDGQWTSRTVFAIIAPGLCMPLILGLPFFEHNNIICDHKRRSCIDGNLITICCTLLLLFHLPLINLA